MIELAKALGTPSMNIGARSGRGDAGRREVDGALQGSFFGPSQFCSTAGLCRITVSRELDLHSDGFAGMQGP